MYQSVNVSTCMYVYQSQAHYLSINVHLSVHLDLSIYICLAVWSCVPIHRLSVFIYHLHHAIVYIDL